MRRGLKMKALMRRLLPLVTDEMLKSFNGDSEQTIESLREDWEERINGIEPADTWVEFYPFALVAVRGGWELADGDPICDWCANTFREQFPHEVEPQALLDRMLQSLNEGLIVTDEQFMEYLDGNFDSICQKAIQREQQ